MDNTCKGKIKTVRFYSEQSKYIVALIYDSETKKNIWVVGNMYGYKQDQEYIFVGEYKTHPKYGKQFSFTSYEEVVLSETDELIAYFSSSIFKGVGKVLATRIVETLGNNCISKIIEDKDLLLDIKGMSKEKADMIYNELANESYDKVAAAYLMKHGFSMLMITRIIDTFKENTMQIVEYHPYQLINVEGLGFKAIDEYALSLGYDKEDQERIQALIIYILKAECYQKGHTYVHEEQLFYSLSRYDDSLNHRYQEVLEDMLEHQLIYVNIDEYFLPAFWKSEEGIANKLTGFIEEADEIIDEDDVYAHIRAIEEELNIQYSDSQMEALLMFIQKPFMILTGGPGTGKTTLVQGAIKLYQRLNEEKNIALIAPTGRAAKRLNEITNLETFTIHRILKWDMTANAFAVNEFNPLTYDLIIVDEFSMVDTFLFYNLLKACDFCEKLLLIGDEKQLPSVLPGQLLSDLLNVSLIPQCELTEIFRQKEDSGIIQLAHAMRNNEDLEEDFFNQYKDIHFMHTNKVKDTVLKIYNKALEEGYDNYDIQVLAPRYDGEHGIDALNQVLQELVNPKDSFKNEYKYGNKIYREGDRILQLKNRVDDQVFNGDIGVIEAITKQSKTTSVTCLYDDSHVVEYQSDNMNEITHSYCMSIHKAQGSEFKIVILVLTKDSYFMLQKNLIYTAITRAKQSLFIVGDYEAFMIAYLDKLPRIRHTYLTSRFEDELSPYDFMDE